MTAAHPAGSGCPSRPGRAGGRARRERGAVLVEAAIIVPLVLVLTFGIVEFARMFNASSTVSQAARAGGRIASTQPLSVDMPEQAVAAVGSVMTRLQADAPLEAGVYRISSTVNSDGQPPAVCGTVDCVRFTWNPGLEEFEYAGGSWNPASVRVCGGVDDLDRVGVYVRSRVAFITGLFGATRDIDDHAVFRLEPQSDLACQAVSGT